jgi:hypothetical protein
LCGENTGWIGKDLEFGLLFLLWGRFLLWFCLVLKKKKKRGFIFVILAWGIKVVIDYTTSMTAVAALGADSRRSTSMSSFLSFLSFLAFALAVVERTAVATFSIFSLVGGGVIGG